MEYNDMENDEDDSLKDTGSTAYWMDEWENEKKAKEEEEKKLSELVDIYVKCTNPRCGYVSKSIKKVEFRYVDEIMQKYSNSKCPICGHKGFKLISKKEFEKLNVEFKKKQHEKEKKKKLDIKKKLEVINSNIRDDVEDLMEDLNSRLIDGKMSPKTFVNIFYKLSVNIAKRYTKDIPGSLDPSYYKSILSICDIALDKYNVKEDAETVLGKMDEEIEENKLYIAEYEYYINDEKYSIADYEMSERIKEYEKSKDNLFKQERMKEIEEEYQDRRKELAEKADKRLVKEGDNRATIKGNVIKKASDLFGKAKDDLQIKRRLDILIQRYVPYILDSYGIRNVDENVQDVIYESLQTVYNLDKNLDKKEDMFNNILNYSIESRREEIINTDNNDLKYELVDVNNEFFSRYLDEKEKIDRNEKAEQYEYFTHEPEFKSKVRQILERKGIQNEEVIYEIENRVKNTVGYIYEDYNEADKSISNNLEKICDEELGKYEQQVTTSRQDIKPESKEKNGFTEILQAGVNSKKEIGEIDMANIINNGDEHNKDDPNKDKPNKDKKFSLPDNPLR